MCLMPGCLLGEEQVPSHSEEIQTGSGPGRTAVLSIWSFRLPSIATDSLHSDQSVRNEPTVAPFRPYEILEVVALSEI